MEIAPTVLAGKHVRLEPLSPNHVDGLTDVGLDPSIWEYMIDRITDRAGMLRFVEAALRDEKKGTALPFVTKTAESDKIVGTTRFGNIDKANRRVEIGWTWVAPAWQRSAVNTEAKLLMLTHAFQAWRCIRVEFKTDALNHRSRKAILRLGAVEEGTLRQHMITGSGRLRDSVYFSILDGEWERVKQGLLEKLNK
jgi:RimJ/RimL family protein N-acetyltransferase